MKHRIFKLLSLVALILSGQTAAFLETGDAMIFADGTYECVFGGTPPDNCDFFARRVVGSYFAIDTDGSGDISEYERLPMNVNDGLVIGDLQPATGSHPGCPDGTESPGVDAPWCFFGNTGMSQVTEIPVTVKQGNGATKLMDFRGWGVTWNGLHNIPLGGDPAHFPDDTGLAVLACNPSDCSDLSRFSLDYSAHVAIGDPSGFGGVWFVLHLESPVNVNAAISIKIPGGQLQECNSSGGSLVPLSADVLLPDDDSIASVSWTVNGVVAGDGENIEAAMVLGANSVRVDLLSTLGQIASDTATVTIRDTVAPAIHAGFFDEQTGGQVSQISHSDRVNVKFSALDVCDDAPSVDAVMGTRVENGHLFNVTTSGMLIIKEVESLDLSVTAMDASGNQSSLGRVLVVTE